MPKIPVDLPASIKDLPHKEALLCLKIEKTASCLPEGLPGKHFLLAVSGGADSTALAIIFYLLAIKNSFRIEIIHIDHMLRPESAKEQEFVKTLAEALEVNFHAEKLETARLARESGKGLEEAGRMGRIAILERICASTNADFILTGHHAGDLAEDVLMRLARGTGWPGLGGMKMLNNHFFRPLLFTEAKNLRRFLKSINIGWCEDPSNKSDYFTRNRFRNEILPLFVRENDNFTGNIVELHELARIDSEYWEKRIADALAAQPWIETRDNGFIRILLPRSLLENKPSAMRLRIYMAVLSRIKELGGLPVHARARTLLQLEESLFKESGKIFQLPGNVNIHTSRKGLLFAAPLLRKPASK